MLQKRMTAIVGIIALLVVILYAVSRTPERDAPKLTEGEPVTDFAFPPTPGLPAHMADLKGKVVLIDFWATWCGPCQRSIPEVARVYNKYKGQGFVAVGVSEDLPNTQNQIPGVAQALGITYPVVLASRVPTALRIFAHQGIPTFVLIDKAGKVRLKQEGFAPDMDLAGKVDALLKEKS